eukprot:Sro2403_g326381.1  (576) ;mRNA; r:3584-5455
MPLLPLIDTMDASALFGALDNPVATSKWTISKNQPLEMVLMAKADLETVKIFYEFYPKALTKNLFRNVLISGAKPGVVGFLASVRPNLVDDATLILAVVQGPGPDRPTESEIILLAEINPDMLVPPGPEFRMPHSLRLVLNWKYSKELTQALFQMVASKVQRLVLPKDFIMDDLPSIFPWVGEDIVNSPLKRTALDMEALVSMEPILGSNNIISLESWCDTWELDAFSQFVQGVVSNQGIHRLLLRIPDMGQQKRPTWFNTETKFAQLLAECSLKILRLDMGPLDVGFLKHCLDGMTCLESLDIKLVKADLAAASAVTATISRFLRTDDWLESLIIEASSDKTARGLDPILNALESNDTLTGFYYYQGDTAPDKFQRYHQKLTDILRKSNSTLQVVHFIDGVTDNNQEGNLCSPLHPSQHLLPFYTTLNRFQRKNAHNPQTSKADFVKLVVQVTQKAFYFDQEKQDPCTEEDILNIVYGLLRGNPNTWCHHQPLQSPERKKSNGSKHEINTRNQEKDKVLMAPCLRESEQQPTETNFDQQKPSSNTNSNKNHNKEQLTAAATTLHATDRILSSKT